MRHFVAGIQPVVVLALAAVAVPQVLQCQTGTDGPFNPLSATTSGVRLQSVSIFSSYYQGGPPGTSLFSSSGQTPAVTAGLSYGVSASFAWTHFSEQSSLTANYTPTYFGSARDSSLNTVNHQMGLNWNRKLGHKWSLTVSAAGVLSNLQQMLFSPTTASAAISLPTTFDDFAAAIVAGKFTNVQLAAILTGSPLLASPAQTFPYGERFLSVSSQAGLTWSPSERSSFHFGASGTRMQSLKAGADSQQTGAAPIAQTTDAAANLGWSYSLTPRTQFGINGTATRIFARLEKGITSSGSLSFSRTMSRRWLVQLTAGAGSVNYQQSALPTPRSLQYTAGANVAYKLQSQTFTASYNRMVGDSYGLGAGATVAAAAAWHWQHPGSRWSLSASFDRQELAGSTFLNSASWRVSGGISRPLSSHLFASLQYGYYRLPANLKVANESLAQSGVVLTLGWSPATY